MTKRKDRHIGRWILGAVLLLTLISFLYISYSVSAEIPRISEFDRSRISSGVPFSSYEKLPNETYSRSLAICGESEPTSIDGIGEVKPVMVNENYFSIYGIHVGGSGITKEHIESRLPAIVISDKAARSLSLNAEVVGQKVYLYGKDFTIVGIYKKQTGFLREISSDPYDRVYIPYSCYEGYSDVPIDTLAAPDGTISEKALSLLGMTGTDTGFYIENDLTIKHDILMNLPNLFITALAIVLALIAVKAISRILKHTAAKLRADSENDYPGKVLKKNLGYISLRLLAVMIFIAVPAALLIFCPPRLVLPQNYIPLDNVFEISHYIDSFKDTLQLNNAGLACGNRYLSHLFWISGTICAAEFAVLTAVLCFSFGRLNKAVTRLTECLGV